MMADDRIAARMAVLRAKFVAELADDRAALRRHRTATLDKDELGAILHRLAGRGGTFGFTGISELAGRLEALCAEDAIEGSEAARLFDALDAAMTSLVESEV
ncbi:hypothetical protein EIK56_13980 [Sphingomonas sp. C8-2]|jgi:HPt (histidine-containing phosphotransfer) domain-containing protein|nr:hypothetical protein EIK56_13980 [Sphingomonas sp. C8-2]